MLTRLRLPVGADEWAGVAVVVAVASLTFAGTTVLAGLLAVAAMLCGIPAALRGIRTPIGAFAAATVLGWLAYAAIIGSLPSPTSLGDLLAWLDGDARLMFPFGFIVAMAGLRNRDTYRRALLTSWWLIVVTTAVSVVLMPWWPYMLVTGLLRGFTSSHHVMGALTAAAILLAAGLRDLIDMRSARWFAYAVLAAGLALSGSRASMGGLAVGLLVIVVPRLDRRQVVAAGLVAVIGITAAFAAIPRLRDTATTVLSLDFASNVRIALDAQTLFEIEEISDSVAAENIYRRVMLWGYVTDRIVASPLIGIGPFRLNDRSKEYTGVEGFVYVATSAQNQFDDSQGHNTALHVTAETGLVGLAVFVAPFALSWHYTTRRGGRPDPPSRFEHDLVLTIRAFLASSIVVGQVSEGVFSPSTGIPVAIVAIGGSVLLARSTTTDSSATGTAHIRA